MQENKIKILLLKNNLTAKELGEIVGVDKANMSRIVNGLFMPTPDMAQKIAKLLNCHITDIWSKKDLTYLKPHTSLNFNFCDKEYAKTQYRVNKVGCNLLQQVYKLGYKTKKEWFNEKLNELAEEAKLKGVDINYGN